jgi:hypothetical protein
VIAAPLTTQLERAKNGLEDAQIALCGAVTAHTEAKRALELAEARKTCEGVEGRNEKERAAKLRLELEAEHKALHEAEDALAEARCALDGARLEWDLARYSLRALEVESVIGRQAGIKAGAIGDGDTALWTIRTGENDARK